MKNKNLIFTTFVTTLLLFQTANASIDLSIYQKTIQEITDLETANPYLATLKSISAANQIAFDIKVDAVVTQVNERLNEIRQEVVTNTKRTGLSASLLGLFSIGYHKNVDLTQILTTNAGEVAAFEAKQTQRFQLLQSQLYKYAKDNELALFYSKVFAAKALQIMEKLPIASLSQIYPEASLVVQRVAFVNFYGESNVTRCVTTNYADKVNEESASISGFFFSLAASDSRNQKAYSASECSNSGQTQQIEQSSLFSSKLIFVDQALSNYSKAVSLRMLVEKSAPSYPTWGSPAFSK